MSKAKIKDDNVIYVTRDYSMFKTVRGNREVDKGHVAKLKKKSRKEILIFPSLSMNMMKL